MWYLCWSMNVFEYVWERLARYIVPSKNICKVASREIFCSGGFKTYMFILWYATQFCLFAIQDFDSRLILYLNRPVIVFNVNIYVEVLQLLSGLQYSCHIQGDISIDAIASRKDYFIVKSKVIFSKVVSFHQSCNYVSLYNSYYVWMTLFCLLQTINDFKMCNYNHFRSIWIFCKLYNVS